MSKNTVTEIFQNLGFSIFENFGHVTLVLLKNISPLRFEPRMVFLSIDFIEFIKNIYKIRIFTKKNVFFIAKNIFFVKMVILFKT